MFVVVVGMRHVCSCGWHASWLWLWLACVMVVVGVGMCHESGCGCGWHASWLWLACVMNLVDTR